MAYEEMRIKNETGRCLLCQNAPCSKACPVGIDVAHIIRSLRFENETGAIRKLVGNISCENCSAPCMESCNRGKIDKAIDIPMILTDTRKLEVKVSEKKADLSIDFCGVHCENPFFLSSTEKLVYPGLKAPETLHFFFGDTVPEQLLFLIYH